MLIREYNIGRYLRSYSHFRSALEWLRMYCSGEFGTSRQDYLEGYRHVRQAFARVSQLFRDFNGYLDEYVSRFPNLHLSITLIEELDALISQIEVEEQFGVFVQKISDVVYRFLEKDEQKFCDAYIEAAQWYEGKQEYYEGLFRVIDRLGEFGSDEAVVAAFKHLDKLLRHVVGVKPHELYGEDLIKRAFNVDTGILQLNTLTNEQQSLRNLVSGAYGLFRNPAAHRSLFSGDDALLRDEMKDPAPKLFVLVDLLELIVHNTYRMNLSPTVHKVLAEYADYFTDEKGLVPAPSGINDDWQLATIRVWLHYDDETGFSWGVEGGQHDTQVLRKIRTALTKGTGIRSQ